MVSGGTERAIFEPSVGCGPAGAPLPRRSTIGPASTQTHLLPFARYQPARGDQRSLERTGPRQRTAPRRGSNRPRALSSILGNRCEGNPVEAADEPVAGHDAPSAHRPPEGLQSVASTDQHTRAACNTMKWRAKRGVGGRHIFGARVNHERQSLEWNS